MGLLSNANSSLIWRGVIFSHSSLFLWEIFRAISAIKKKKSQYLRVNIKQRNEFYLKEISKQEIEKLIKANIIKNTGKGYVNPKKNYRVGYYKTCGGHRYIEDKFADIAKRLK